MGKTGAMRIALIANSRSGSAAGPGELEELLAAGGAEVHATEIADLTRAALTAHGPPDRIVVAGGDGSIGPAARHAAELGCPLAVVPAGTANDFARSAGIPLDVSRACALAADPAAGDRTAELALVGDRPFVNAAATGLSVIAAREAHDHKARLGALAYAVGAMKAGAKAAPIHCRVRCDGEPSFEGDVWQVVVGVTGAFGGGSSIGGTATDDEHLDAAVVPAGSRAGLVKRAYGMRTGRLTAQDDVPHLRGYEISVELDTEPSFNVDGELCECDPAHFTLLSGGFRVITPGTAEPLQP